MDAQELNAIKEQVELSDGESKLSGDVQADLQTFFNGELTCLESYSLLCYVKAITLHQWLTEEDEELLKDAEQALIEVDEYIEELTVEYVGKIGQVMEVQLSRMAEEETPDADG